MGGIHRLLIKDAAISRRIDSFHPSKIEEGSQIATIVVENILSGSQILSAMKEYLGVEKSSVTANHFHLDENERSSLKNKLNNLSTLNICTVLYTSTGLEKISNELNNILGRNIAINIVHGRNIKGDATFGTTLRIGEQEKSQIRELLSNVSEMKNFGTYFKRIPNQKVKVLTIDAINSANLVARHQSMPKKAFSFLSTGLRADTTCHPLVRIPESYEITSGRN
jgi:hypothetical protein